ncbi:MAG: DUF302 domain-containing protein [Firmicutes bacterium]|nr:DUF302 domain-containing protein [Bacillota bacterium]
MAAGNGRDYGYRRRVQLSYDEAIQKVRETLKEQGFGVLTEIDVTGTLKQKLDKDFGRRYVILGACNPHLAHRALNSELELGLLLPCNVIVYEDGDGCVIAAVDPGAMLSIVGNPALDEVADEAGKRLRTAIDRAAEGS